MKPSVVTLKNGLCNGFIGGCVVRHDPSLLLAHAVECEGKHEFGGKVA